MNFGWRPTSVLRCSRQGRRCEQIVTTQGSEREFRFLLTTGEDGLGEKVDGDLPAERNAAGCGVHEHQYRVENERDT